MKYSPNILKQPFTAMPIRLGFILTTEVTIKRNTSLDVTSQNLIHLLLTIRTFPKIFFRTILSSLIPSSCRIISYYVFSKIYRK
jgi:hypothetical protein